MKITTFKELETVPLAALKKMLARFGKGGRKRREKRKNLKNLKVGFFTDTYLPNVDGVVSSILSFRKELEARGHEISILASGTEEDEKGNLDDDVFFFKSVKFPPYPQYKIALFPFNAAKIAKEENLEIIHSHAIASMGLAAIGAAKELNLPLVGTFHTMVPRAGMLFSRSEITKEIFSKMAWRTIREFYRPYDIVTSPTETIRKMMNENGIANVEVVPNGIDAKKFSPKNNGKYFREMLGIAKNERMVLTAGRISDEKNVDVIVKAAKEVLKEENAKFVIMGDGPAKQAIAKLVKEEGLEKKVVFVGFVKDFEVPYFYAATDAFVTASTFETQGLALLEVMASGKVCVGADALAIPELLNGRNGFLFEAGNSEACSEAILKALSLEGSKKREMERRARNTALNYTIKKSTDRLLKAYGKVI